MNKTLYELQLHQCAKYVGQDDVGRLENMLENLKRIFYHIIQIGILCKNENDNDVVSAKNSSQTLSIYIKHILL